MLFYQQNLINCTHVSFFSSAFSIIKWPFKRKFLLDEISFSSATAQKNLIYQINRTWLEYGKRKSYEGEKEKLLKYSAEMLCNKFSFFSFLLPWKSFQRCRKLSKIFLSALSQRHWSKRLNDVIKITCYKSLLASVRRNRIKKNFCNFSSQFKLFTSGSGGEGVNW